MSASPVPVRLSVFANMDTDGDPVANNGLAQAPLCKQCEPVHLAAHGEDNIYVTGKTRVDGHGLHCAQYENYGLRHSNV